MHTFPLPGKATAAASGDDAAAAAAAAAKPGSYEWTEWFKGFIADAAAMGDADYAKPLAAVDTWLRSSDGVSSATVDEV